MSKQKEVDPDKLRTMVRSILPSTASRQARFAKRKERRRVRHAARAAIGRVDATGDTPNDLRVRPYQTMNVRDRRQSDKITHFMRWAEAQTRGMTRQQSLDHIRAMLPTNLIGEHAFSHWEMHVRYAFGRRGIRWSERARREAQSWKDRTVRRLERMLRTYPDGHGLLNRFLKASAYPVGQGVIHLSDHDRAELRKVVAAHPLHWAEPRLLAGLHDVEAFVVAHAKTSRALDAILDRIEMHAQGELEEDSCKGAGAPSRP